MKLLINVKLKGLTLKTFKHSGDLGDIIYSLPAIKALGGGVLYLDPTGGLNDPLVSWGVESRYQQTSLNEKSISSIAPLLLQQDYIKDVKIWNDDCHIDYNLNNFRKNIKTPNLSDAHLSAFNLSLSHKNSAWLKVDRGIDHPEGKSILITRSLRVHSNHSFWENLSENIIYNSVFVGNSFEYEVFNKTFRYKIPFWELSILDLSRAIKNCSLFISNQTLGSAIAEGFKKNLIQEVYRICPLAIFERKGATYV